MVAGSGEPRYCGLRNLANSGDPMITIYKYPVSLVDEQDIMMPLGAEILTIQTQNGEICLWAKVDPELPKVPHRVLCRGTGHACRGVGRYLSTVQLAGGDLVFHFFSDLPPDTHLELRETVETPSQFTQ
jgi:hypothetical protein